MTTTITWVPRRDVTETMFSDNGITTSAITSMDWADGALTIVFADDLTDSQIIDCKFLMGSRDITEALLFGQGLQSIIANLAWTGDTESQAATLIYQVGQLSDQMNNVFRLLLGPLSDLTPP